MLWLQFTAVSRKPAASAFRIEYLTEDDGSRFFETYIILYQASTHRIADGSNLQKCPSLEGPAYTQLSLFRQVRFTYLDVNIQYNP